MKIRQMADSCFQADWPSSAVSGWLALVSAVYASSCNVKYAQIHENLPESYKHIQELYGQYPAESHPKITGASGLLT